MKNCMEPISDVLAENLDNLGRVGESRESNTNDRKWRVEKVLNNLSFVYSYRVDENDLTIFCTEEGLKFDQKRLENKLARIDTLGLKVKVIPNDSLYKEHLKEVAPKEEARERRDQS